MVETVCGHISPHVIPHSPSILSGFQQQWNEDPSLSPSSPPEKNGGRGS